jgi:hypothetical protein
MFKKASKSVVPFDLLSPTPSTSSAMRASKITEEDPDDPEPADEEDIEIQYSTD